MLSSCMQANVRAFFTIFDTVKDERSSGMPLVRPTQMPMGLPAPGMMPTFMGGGPPQGMMRPPFPGRCCVRFYGSHKEACHRHKGTSVPHVSISVFQSPIMVPQGQVLATVVVCMGPHPGAGKMRLLLCVSVAWAFKFHASQHLMCPPFSYPVYFCRSVVSLCVLISNRLSLAWAIFISQSHAVCFC